MTLTELDQKIADREARLTHLRSEVFQLEADIKAAKDFRKAFPRFMEDAPTMQPVHVQVAPLIVLPETKSQSDSSIIRSAIERCPVDYTIYDIEKHVAEMGHAITRLKISQTMSDWARKEKVRVKVRGVGNSVATYTKDTTEVAAARAAFSQ